MSVFSFRYFFAIVLFVNSILGFYYASRVFYAQNYKKVATRLFSYTALASAFWSLSYCVRRIVENETYFAWAKTIGYTSLFAFIILGQIMISLLSGLFSKLKHIFLIEAILSILVLLPVNSSKYTYYVHTPYGILAHFNSAALNILFTCFTLIMALCFIALSLEMLRPYHQNCIKAFGHYFLYIELLIMGAMVLDTFLPAVGINFNIPSSSVAQFYGLVIINYAVHKLEKNQINIVNFTAYVHSSFKSPMLVFDYDHKLKVCNDYAREIFDIKDTDFEKIGVWENVFHLDPPENIDTATDTLEMDGHYSPKNMDFRLHIDPIINDYKDYLGYLVLVSDISLTMQYLKELEASKAEAINANRSKSMFLANMSHEIRTPMNSILSFSKIALTEDMPQNAKEYFTDIKNSAESLLSIINDILNISKLESGSMELNQDEYYPAKIFRDVNTIINMQAISKNLTYITNIDPELPNKLYGDKDKMREILINLLNNGVKYTNEGTVRLDIKLMEINGDMAKIKINCIDNGIGIKPEDKESIFSNFTRVDGTLNAKTEGTGLGLSITKGIVDLMGGTISVDSVYGIGSNFEIIVEQKIVDASPINFEIEEEKALDYSNLHFRNLKVLAVDDNATNLKVISKILSKFDLEYATLNSGEAAIENCKTNNYDLILMDQMMPHVDGVMAMKEIRALGGDYALGGKSKIVALTANVIEGVKDELLAAGFDGFLSKPIDFSEFKKTLLFLLPEEKYYYSEENETNDVSKSIIPTDINESEDVDKKPTSAQSNDMPEDNIESNSPNLDVNSPTYLDREKGLENFDGDEEGYQEIVSFVKETGMNDLNELVELYNSKDWENYIIKVHGMKSQCNYIGGLNMGAMAKALEFAGKDNDLAFIESHMDEFITSFTKFIDDLPQ